MVLSFLARYRGLFLENIAPGLEPLAPAPGDQPVLLRWWRTSEIGDSTDPGLHPALESVSSVPRARRTKRPALILQGAGNACVLEELGPQGEG